ncbi:hypothetical protein CLV30_12732 [Haloactinopolyspora alba]|uniref:Pyrroloquinoline-quinone binding quinoprotein n=1 Tax=Haloactinopolyspora alba TaxID=648780 RepID=A0A2P8DFV7_9ACTN|nr:hypothetical protein [Haloactinopolyspora alba]PSK96091.1 hypothetical protein CLV30_12732 [Haloactinopolyspora alba]
MAWTWGPFEGVVAAGPGAVVRDGGTVRGIDGVSGTERWAYARPGTHVDDIDATPDGSVIVTTFEADRDDHRSEVLVETLDALTGDVLATRRQPAPGSDDELAEHADPAVRHTDHSRIVLHAEVDDDGKRLNTGTLAAAALPDLSAAWTWTVPAECALAAPSSWPDDAWFAYADIVAVSMTCGENPERTVVLGLDAAHGTEQWRVEQDVPPDGSGSRSMFAPARGGVFGIEAPGGTGRLLVRDAADGTVVGELPDTDELFRRAPDGTLEVIASVDGETAQVDQHLVVVDPDTGRRQDLATLGTGAGDTYLWSARTDAGWVGPGTTGQLGVAPEGSFGDWYEIPAGVGGAFGGSYPRVLEPTPGRVLVAPGAVLAVPDCRSGERCHIAGLR